MILCLWWGQVKVHGAVVGDIFSFEFELWAHMVGITSCTVVVVGGSCLLSPCHSESFVVSLLGTCRPPPVVVTRVLDGLCRLGAGWCVCWLSAGWYVQVLYSDSWHWQTVVVKALSIRPWHFMLRERWYIVCCDPIGLQLCLIWFFLFGRKRVSQQIFSLLLGDLSHATNTALLLLFLWLVHTSLGWWPSPLLVFSGNVELELTAEKTGCVPGHAHMFVLCGSGTPTLDGDTRYLRYTEIINV